LSERHEGRVAEFDGQKGYGWLVTDDGRRLFFHCTAIADGSRSIPEGTAVTFDVVPGHLGRWEASGVAPTAPPSAVAGGAG
jgi:CspA family cold shock protein